METQERKKLIELGIKADFSRDKPAFTVNRELYFYRTADAAMASAIRSEQEGKPWLLVLALYSNKDELVDVFCAATLSPTRPTVGGSQYADSWYPASQGVRIENAIEINEHGLSVIKD